MSVIFIDTNCWVYASNPQSSFYEAAQQKLNEFQERDYEICSCPQVIKEYTRVLTSEGLFSPEEIRQKAAFIRQSTTFLSETSGTIAEFEALVESHQVKGKPVYDCNIVAMMLHYDVRTLLTHNVTDFLPRYDALIQVLPLISIKVN